MTEEREGDVDVRRRWEGEVESIHGGRGRTRRGWRGGRKGGGLKSGEDPEVNGERRINVFHQGNRADGEGIDEDRGREAGSVASVANVGEALTGHDVHVC